MNSSRQAFYPELRAMAALTSNTLLVDTFPPSDAHNKTAGILRRGLAVTAFAHLETYLEDRLEELMVELRTCRIPFSRFSADLKKFFSVDAVLGLANRLHFAKNDQQTVAEREIARIAGFKTSPPSYTAQGFSPRGSNVAAGDLAIALTALGLPGKPWTVLAQTVGRLGVTRVSLVDDFTNAARLRHASAHDSSASVPSSDLQTHIYNIILIAIAFDINASTYVSTLLAARDEAHHAALLASASWTTRFLDLTLDSRWAERTSAQGRSIKIYASEDAARTGVAARSNVGFVIIRDDRGTPLELV